MYSKRVLCFSLPIDSNEHKEYIVQLLHTALRATVSEYPFIAGTVVQPSNDRPWIHDVLPQGAAYLEIQDLSDQLSYAKLQEANFPSTSLNTKQLCPFSKPLYTTGFPLDACRIRATFVGGGMLLVASIVHLLCDGQGTSLVLDAFARYFRKAQIRSDNSVLKIDETAPECQYSFDRNSVLNGNGFPGEIEKHPAWTVSPPDPTPKPEVDCVCTTFRITRQSLSTLKRMAAPPPVVAPAVLADDSSDVPASQVPFISTQDALAALIWRSLMLARHRTGILSRDRITYCSVSVDCRSRLELRAPYVGNAVNAFKSPLPLQTFLPTDTPPTSQSDHPTSTPPVPPKGLQAAAQQIRAGINGVTGDSLRDLVALIERNQERASVRMALLTDLLTCGIFMTSYFRFGMHELDFGRALGVDGRIDAFRLPSEGIRPGIPVILPRLPDGSGEFVIVDRREVMACLEHDEVWNTFTEKI